MVKGFSIRMLLPICQGQNWPCYDVKTWIAWRDCSSLVLYSKTRLHCWFVTIGRICPSTAPSQSSVQPSRAQSNRWWWPPSFSTYAEILTTDFACHKLQIMADSNHHVKSIKHNTTYIATNLTNCTEAWHEQDWLQVQQHVWRGWHFGEVAQICYPDSRTLLILCCWTEN